MLSDLLLLSGNDIPFPQAQIVIHQPTLKEIAYIGEETFYTGCEFLNFSKDILSEKDRSYLEDKSNFEILMILLKEKNAVIQKNKVCILMVLTILFPNYQIEIKDNYFSLIEDDKEFKINKENFEDFKTILDSIFCLKGIGKDKEGFNPQGEMSRKIAEKLKQRHQKLAEKER